MRALNPRDQLNSPPARGFSYARCEHLPKHCPIRPQMKGLTNLP